MQPVVSTPIMKKVCLVTGGTGGIGLAKAREFLLQDREVVILSRSGAKCSQTIDLLKQETGKTRFRCLVADLTSLAQTAAATQSFIKEIQSIGFLVFKCEKAVFSKFNPSSERMESNLAAGFLSRALMSFMLAPLLESTHGSHIMGVEGLDRERFDLYDVPNMSSSNFSDSSALSRWQWAYQLFTNVWNEKQKVPMNL